MTYDLEKDKKGHPSIYSHPPKYWKCIIKREQCIIARNRANKILGFLGRCVTNKSSEVILRLYLALVRLHLDYAAQFWSPYYRKDIGSLEAVQRRMNKMIQGLRNLPYKDRLKRLNLYSLEQGFSTYVMLCTP